MKKNRIIAVLAVLLVLSVVANLIQMQQNSAGKPIVGTFIHADEGLTGVHLVFTSEGSFIKYRQFDVLCEGQYISSGSGVYTLQSDTDGSVREIIFFDERVYVIDQVGNQFLIFERLDTIPLFINVTP